MKSNSEKAIQSIRSTINARLVDRVSPLVVSIDGGSGAGKSTLAIEIAKELDATVIHCDDFFVATVLDDEWDRYSLEQRCLQCIDWNRMRKEVLLPLIAGNNATYHPFSFTEEDGLAAQIIVKNPAKVIILDGIYSSLPVLSDVVDVKVLVDVLPTVRRLRHNSREGNADEEWHQRWDPVEDYYFSNLCPPETYDLIVTNM